MPRHRALPQDSSYQSSNEAQKPHIMQSSTPYTYFNTLYIVADPSIASLSQKLQKKSLHYEYASRYVYN